MVTGASTGIGEQMAYHYGRFGAQIVITARREKVLQQVSELAENGIKEKKKTHFSDFCVHHDRKRHQLTVIKMIFFSGQMCFLYSFLQQLHWEVNPFLLIYVKRWQKSA